MKKTKIRWQQLLINIATSGITGKLQQILIQVDTDSHLLKVAIGDLLQQT